MLSDPPASSVCEVWYATLAEFRPEFLGLLDPIESARLDRFTRVSDARRCALGAVLLRVVAARHLGGSPAAIAVARRCSTCGESHGKPRVVGGLEVSLAHAGDLVVVAATTGGPVGVDIESVSLGARRIGLGRSFAPGDEGAPYDARAYLVDWTRREAILKATGDGLTVSPSDLVLSGPAAPLRLLAWKGRARPECSLADLDLPSDYVGAVAVLTSRPSAVRLMAATPLLDDARLSGEIEALVDIGPLNKER